MKGSIGTATHLVKRTKTQRKGYWKSFWKSVDNVRKRRAAIGKGAIAKQAQIPDKPVAAKKPTI
jgi:hypothetical protein